MVQDRWRQSPGGFGTEAVICLVSPGMGVCELREGAVADNELTGVMPQGGNRRAKGRAW